MKPKKRQKLCHHCEGEVDLDVIVCPFCAADLREERPEQQKNNYTPGLASVRQINTEQSLYPPPYGRNQEEEPQQPIQERVLPSLPQEDAEEDPTSLKPAILGISLFTLGVHFFLLTLMMFFFSDRGVLLLQWNAGLWPFYLLASLPLLAFGYRLMKKL